MLLWLWYIWGVLYDRYCRLLHETWWDTIIDFLTMGSCFSISSRVSKSVFKGNTVWSYSIIQDLTPGLVSNKPSIFYTGNSTSVLSWQADMWWTIGIDVKQSSIHQTCTKTDTLAGPPLNIDLHSMVLDCRRNLAEHNSQQASWIDKIHKHAFRVELGHAETMRCKLRKSIVYSCKADTPSFLSLWSKISNHVRRHSPTWIC